MNCHLQYQTNELDLFFLPTTHCNLFMKFQVKPWTCLLHLFDVYFVLPYIDCVQKIQLIQDAQLQLGPQSCILHLKDGTTLQIFWCVRLLSTTNFPGSVKDNPRKYRITECVESTLKKSAVKYSFKSFNTFKTGKKLVQKVADNLKYVLSAPPFPAGTVHHFDVQLGREVQDALGRSQYFEADICSPIMAFDTLVTT